MNDEDAIRHACQGDEAAWLALVRKYQNPIFRLAYLLLGDADEAEDLAQETLIRAYRSLDRFDATLRCVLGCCKSHAIWLTTGGARCSGIHAAVSRWWQQNPVTPSDPPSTAGQLADAELLQQAVQQLAHGDQEVIYLRYFLELSVAETAQTLGVAEGTVKSRLSRALNRLRTVIDAAYPQLREEVRS
ncbi:MAG: RNA polymerase sigma factor [Caldilineaceae bacterium]